MGNNKILLHVCCAPCSGAVIENVVAQGITPTLFFYNPNIHPRQEYETRKAEIVGYAERKGLAFVDADYDPDEWFRRVKGLENEPECGARCAVCFDTRLERAALYAHENGFGVFATSLGISRHKNLEQVNASGHRAAAPHDGLRYLDHNWRKKGGSERAAQIARDEGFYRQKYCGCVYSYRDSNRPTVYGR